MDVKRLHIAGAQCREHRGERRKQDLLDPGAGGDPAGVQRSVASVGEHRVVLDQASARTQLLLDPDGHLLVDRALDDLGNLDGFQVKLIAQALLDRIDRPLLVELDVPVGVVVRVEVAKQQVGVRDGRLHTAAVVAGRTRIRSRGLRPDLDGMVNAVEAGNGTATGPKGIQVDHRRRHHPPPDRRLEVVVSDPALGHQPDVERRASHVHRDDITKAC